MLNGDANTGYLLAAWKSVQQISTNFIDDKLDVDVLLLGDKFLRNQLLHVSLAEFVRGFL